MKPSKDRESTLLVIALAMYALALGLYLSSVHVALSARFHFALWLAAGAGAAWAIAEFCEKRAAAIAKDEKGEP